jgi:hypothetical protein
MRGEMKAMRSGHESRHCDNEAGIYKWSNVLESIDMK